jgi:hypothetical protein
LIHFGWPNVSNTPLGIKYMSSNNEPDRFMKDIVPFANTECFGSLCCSVFIHPSTQNQFAEEFDACLAGLDWGTIGVNQWGLWAAIVPATVWGAPPNRHSPEDIQSGTGQWGNCYGVSNIYKSVLRAKWCDPAALLAPPSAKGAAVYRPATMFYISPGFMRLGRLLTALVAGI